MQLFDVYPLYAIEPDEAWACVVKDRNGTEYLDFYGGHAVISVGHRHPHYVKLISEQLQRIGFYSNSVENTMQSSVAEKLGRLSGYGDYSFFFCNSGAEANENALKLASFASGRSRIAAFRGSFHGRTSGTVALTDNPSLLSPFNAFHQVEFLPLNDLVAAEKSLSKGDLAAVIIEGIQGVGGIHVPDPEFLQGLHALCKRNGTSLILDEIQSGYGRSGKFFAHQHAGIRPELVTVAKGMGNGFPVGGVLIAPGFTASHGLLGTTFGGNHLACAASLAVLDILEDENLLENAEQIGRYLAEQARGIEEIAEVRGTGLMIGLEFPFEVTEIRKLLLYQQLIFTGYSGKKTIRLLPPLCIGKPEADRFIGALKSVLQSVKQPWKI